MKKIKIKEQDVQEIMDKVRTDLTKKGVPERINVEVNPSILLAKDQKAKLVFEAEAYRKMRALIDQCEKEIGWYGIVKRDEEDSKKFWVTDIVMFPQKVTGATVTTDDEPFIKWENELDDYTFNNLKFYGHSHVNMATSPSGVDTTFQSDKLQNEKRVYIFYIGNKKKENWVNIYDVENNILYESKDIEVTYIQDSVADWADEMIKKYVTEKTYATPATSATSVAEYPKTPSYYGGYGYGYGAYQKAKEKAQKQIDADNEWWLKHQQKFSQGYYDGEGWD